MKPQENMLDLMTGILIAVRDDSNFLRFGRISPKKDVRRTKLQRTRTAILVTLVALLMGGDLWYQHRAGPQRAHLGRGPARPPVAVIVLSAPRNWRALISKNPIVFFWLTPARTGNTCPDISRAPSISPWSPPGGTAVATADPWPNSWDLTRTGPWSFTERAWPESAATRRPGWPFNWGIKTSIAIPWATRHGRNRACRWPGRPGR